MKPINITFIKTGSDTIKAGFAGDDAPRTVVPCVVLNVELENSIQLTYFANIGLQGSFNLTPKCRIKLFQPH